MYTAKRPYRPDMDELDDEIDELAPDELDAPFFDDGDDERRPPEPEVNTEGDTFFRVRLPRVTLCLGQRLDGRGGPAWRGKGLGRARVAKLEPLGPGALLAGRRSFPWPAHTQLTLTADAPPLRSVRRCASPNARLTARS
jgi:hypothetical protein